VAVSILTGAGVVAFGLLVGALSALMGIGGGVALVPFIVLVLDRAQQTAEGTSLLVILPTALAGVLAHQRRGYVSLKQALALGAGGAGGALGGAAVALTTPGSVLETGVGVLVIVVGGWLIVRARRA
jgi:uncharacterized membrane protein YfcA